MTYDNAIRYIVLAGVLLGVYVTLTLAASYPALAVLAAFFLGHIYGIIRGGS